LRDVTGGVAATGGVLRSSFGLRDERRDDALYRAVQLLRMTAAEWGSALTTMKRPREGLESIIASGMAHQVKEKVKDAFGAGDTPK
jgi:hypothetical protein